MLIAAFESFLSPKTLITFVAGLGNTFIVLSAFWAHKVVALQMMKSKMRKMRFIKYSVPHSRSTLYANVYKIPFRLSLNKL